MANERTDRQTWLCRAQAWKRSGLPCKEFAKQEGWNAATLAWWSWKLRATGEDVPGGRKHRRARRKSKRAKRREKPTFVEVTPVVELEPVAASTIELEAAGVVVRVDASFDGGHLSRVLDVLEARR